MRAENATIEALLERRGALLFRGFGIDDAAALAELLAGLGVEPLAYVGGNTPRSIRRDAIYSATEYSAAQRISLHNELSYSQAWPAWLFFCCATPPVRGGATTLADGRRVLAALEPRTVDAFRTRGVRYVRNLHGGRGLGRSWQATFETDERAKVEQACAAAGSELEWQADGSVRIVHRGPGVITHPRLGVEVWFNQAEQFHPTSLPDEVAQFLLDDYAGREHELPQWACFGDGEPIPVAMLAEVRAALERETLAPGWQRGDLMLIDNILALHGREPYTGERDILVAMAHTR